MKRSYEEVKNIIESYGCKLLSDSYKNNAEKIKIQCFCGEVWETTFGIFNAKSRRRCVYCAGVKKRQSEVISLVESKGCKLLEPFQTVNKTMKLQCSCGEVFHTTYNNFLSNGKEKCNKCSLGRKNKTHLTQEEVREYVESKGVSLLSEYVNSKEKMKLRCSCGDIYYADFNKFKSSNKVRCNTCTKSYSKIEILAKMYFEKNNILYKPQVTFEDLKVRYNVNLRFDYGIYNQNGDLELLIELDGKQHFEPLDVFGGEKGFETISKNDKTKEEYCKKNNIRLERIPYYKFNKIESELFDILKYDNSVPSH